MDAQTITASRMRELNRSAILELIRRQSPISRTAIAEQVGASLPTVMRIVEQLVDEGLVQVHGTKERSGGRRRELLEFKHEAHVVIGVDLGGLKMYGAVVDLGANILEEANIPRHASSGEENFSNLVKLIEILLASPQLRDRKLWGICVGAPSVTGPQDGEVGWAHSLNWTDFPLKARLAERFQHPIFVDNDVNLAALGEYWFGAGQNLQHVVFFSVGTGIGAGLILNGALYRGAAYASGELGNILPGVEFLRGAYEKFGALESLASTFGIVDQARLALGDRPDSSRTPELSVESILEAARRGETWAHEVIERTIDYLAVGVANIMALYDPELIVLGGEIAQRIDLIQPILERIRGSLPVAPRLVVSILENKATVVGAITNILQNTAAFSVERKLA
jgi:predicted NBD/HSP70 family sugar kinase